MKSSGASQGRLGTLSVEADLIVDEYLRRRAIRNARWLETNAPRCKRGHVLNTRNLYLYVGQTRGDRMKRQCKTCKLDRQAADKRLLQEAARKRKVEQAGGFVPDFPAAPLLRYIDYAAVLKGTNAYDLRRELGLNGSTKPTTQLGWERVDRICCAVGVHPSNIYPEWDRMEVVA